MAKPLIGDELWEIIEPLLPVKKRRFRHPGRKPIDNRKALSAILFVLRTGIPWEYLPQELGWGSGMTAWRRLEAWQKRGVWKKVHESLLARLQGADKIDWSRVVVDSSSIRALHGEKNGSQPHRSWAEREQAPHCDRRERHFARAHTDWCQRVRRYPDDPAGGCGLRGARQAGKTAPQAGARSGRPSVRLEASSRHAP